MGKGFKFSLDVDIGADTALEYDKHLILSQYLQEVSNNSSLSILLRKVLIGERWPAHQDRWNANKTPDPFKVGDTVKSHVQVHSNSKKVVIKKLYYW